MDREWQTLKEVAEELKVSAATLYNLRHVGAGPRGYRVGRELRFRRSDVETWLASRQDAAPGAASTTEMTTPRTEARGAVSPTPHRKRIS